MNLDEVIVRELQHRAEGYERDCKPALALECRSAIEEVRQRALCEERLTEWLKKPSGDDEDDSPRAARQTLLPDGQVHIELWGTRRHGAFCGRAADRWKAADAALDAEEGRRR